MGYHGGMSSVQESLTLAIARMLSDGSRSSVFCGFHEQAGNRADDAQCEAYPKRPA
jgi:hypothetical protein